MNARSKGPTCAPHWEGKKKGTKKKGTTRVEITQQDVEKVAQLARLAVSAAEKETFAKQLTQILAHVDTLNQYDTTGIEPTATVMGQVNVFRDDLVRPSLPSDKALANAPEREADGFVVPKILEER
ncbi:MAG TPA: Asp-tRNA(Asn)/Glu-tRNA(Gln) amidotransferase subunit GatC [Nitrospira sp.]|nr:Asp-tRNA(Asn)/Glu-tRNA(Gln) amidotransferase subunit GatC [Nitrospira sp.]